jgi:hypothetical protein
MPKAAVNQTELAASIIRRPYQRSISDLARGENSRTTEFAAIASPGFGVSFASLALASLSQEHHKRCKRAVPSTRRSRRQDRPERAVSSTLALADTAQTHHLVWSQ